MGYNENRFKHKRIYINTFLEKVRYCRGDWLFHTAHFLAFWQYGDTAQSAGRICFELCNEKMYRGGKQGMDAFFHVGRAYIEMAFDEPNLFQYLFMNGGSGNRGIGFRQLVNTDEKKEMIQQITADLQMPEEKTS